jgi:hypothetical protein
MLVGLIGRPSFITNKRRNFPATVSEIDSTFPDALGNP